MATKSSSSFPSSDPAPTDDTPPEDAPEERQPLAGDDLKEAIQTRLASINERMDSAQQAIADTLRWVLDLIDPQPEPEPVEAPGPVESTDTTDTTTDTTTTT